MTTVRKLNQCYCPTCKAEWIGFALADHEGARRFRGVIQVECQRCAGRKIRIDIQDARRAFAGAVTRMMRATFGPAGPIRRRPESVITVEPGEDDNEQ